MIEIGHFSSRCWLLQAGVDSITRTLALEWGTDYEIRDIAMAALYLASDAGQLCSPAFL